MNPALAPCKLELGAESGTLAHWVENCAPVIMQPELDVRNGYGLRLCFFHHNPGARTVEVSLVYDGEGSYQRNCPHRHNTIATWFYRSFNFASYRRTADVNRLVYEGVDLSPSKDREWWTALRTTDYPAHADARPEGYQTWSRGDGCSCCCWFSLMSHYSRSVPAGSWEVITQTPQQKGSADGQGMNSCSMHPVVWLATSNHMMCERNVNVDTKFPDGWRRWFPLRHGTGYSSHRGSRQFADAWAEDNMPVKPNFCRCLPWVCGWQARYPLAEAVGR